MDDMSLSIPSRATGDKVAARHRLRLAIVGLSWLVAVASVAGQWVLLGVADAGGVLATQVVPTDLAGSLVALVLGSFGAVVALRGESRAYGWLMLAMGLSLAVIGFAGHFSLYAQETAVPAADVAVWIQDLWMVTPMMGLLLLPSLFPDGRVASSGWRFPVRMAAAAWTVLIVVFALTDRNATNFLMAETIVDPPENPTGVLSIPEMAINVSWLVASLGSIGIGIGSLVTRWRGADAELRERIKWVLYAFSLLLAIQALDLANQALVEGPGVDLGISVPLNTLTAAGYVGLAIALGLAVLRLRLFDVEIVINRTIVYGGLTLAAVAIYVGVVAAAGALLPIQDSFAALVATGVIAVAFAPLRDRMQGWVNRLMFGQRHEPYSVLSELSRLLARSGAPEATLQTLTETVADSLKLRGVAIELEEDGDWRMWAGHGELTDSGDDRNVILLRHRGEVVGRLLVVSRAPGESLSVQDLELLEYIAHQAGALVRSVRLTKALQVSRERMVLAREEERRRLRRDLHDEVGPTLASQTLQFDSVLERMQDDPVRAAELVSALKEQNQQLVADIRRLVYELRPPALDELGVDGALAAHAWQLEHSGRLTIDVRIVPDPLPDLPAAVEVAAYRIAREAMTNTVRHADATRCLATLEVTGETLTVRVRDDGVGMDESVRPGIGLTSMRERAEELGGAFALTQAGAMGTEVTATLPLLNGSSRPDGRNDAGEGRGVRGG